MQPTFAAMSALGWNVIQVPDGNDLAAVYLAVERGLQQARANPRAPVCLWVKTIKGFGVKSTMESASGGHGFPLANGEKIVEFVNEIYFGGEVPAELAAWAQRPPRRLGEKRRRQKSQSRRRRRPPRPRSRRTKSRPGWARARCGPPRRACRSIPFPPIWPGPPACAFFQKSFPGRFLDVGRGGGEHDQRRRRAGQGRADSYS